MLSTTCPRCYGPMLPDPDGPSCLCCGYVSYSDPPLPWVSTMLRKEEWLKGRKPK